MKSNFEECMARLLAHEGGYVWHAEDPGGETNLGVTRAVYEQYAGRQVMDGEMEGLTHDDVYPIYKAMAAANAKSGFAAALSGSVRPVVTYLLVGLFLTVKISGLVYSLGQGLEFHTAMREIWSDDTNLLFTSVISFWFGSRQFAKMRNNKK